MVTSLGKYAWDEDETAVYSHLFLGQEAALGKADIRVESAYPWEGSVTYHVSAKIDELFTLASYPGLCERPARDGQWGGV